MADSTSSIAFSNVTANGQTWRYFERGSGPVVLFIHGFPDAPQSWSDAVDVAVDAGFRAVVPFLRGYHPDTVVEGRDYGSDNQGQDVLGLMDALDVQEAVLVGHDWGASAIFSALDQAPERVLGLVPIAISHPASLKPSLSLVLRARHLLGLKMPWANTMAKRANFAYIDTLYKRWAPGWTDQSQVDSVARVKELFADDRVLSGALDYYRALELKTDRSAGEGPKVSAPTLLYGGGEDFDPSAFDRSLKYFDQARVVMVAGAGHWPHREDPSQFRTEFGAFLHELKGS